ncbi:glycosyltransferase family 39 protein [Catellatospora methionotrophica]|uniref:glycosyltransferase family 39 protein n=1 Tax=Catellatospora methionotrophica TaxID=121620 RepID=UPI0033C72044
METLPYIDVSPLAARIPPAAVMAAPALLTLAVGLIGGTGRQLWQDELATWWSSTIGWADLRTLLGHDDVVFAPYYLLMRAWVAVFGDSVFALRAPALLAMAATAALVAALGRRLFGAHVGLLAGAVFALLPSISRYAQEARPYALVLAGVTGSALLLVRATDRPGPARWSAYAAVAAVTTALHPLVLPFLLAHAGWAWRRRQASAFLLAGTVAATPGVGLLWAAQRQTDQVSWIDTPWWSGLTMVGDLLFSPLLPLLTLAAVGTAAARHRRTEPDAVALLVVWSFAPILLLYALRPVQDLFIPRYLLYVLPAWAILAAVTLADLHTAMSRRRPPRPARFVAGSAAVLLVALTLPGHRDARIDPPWQPDLRALAAVIAASQQPGDAVAFQNASWNERLSLRYALREAVSPRDAFAVQPASRGGYAVPECTVPRTCLGDAPRIWLITQAPPGDPLADLPPGKAELLREEYTVAQAFPAHLVQVVLLVRRPKAGSDGV